MIQESTERNYLYVQCDARINFRHHRLPPPIPANEFDLCLQERNQESKQKIIEGHLRLAMKLVSIFAQRSIREKQELVGVAFLALVEAVNDLEIKKIVDSKQAGAYINKSISWALREYLCEGHVIRIPRASYNRKPDAGLRDPESLKADATSRQEIISLELKEILKGLGKNNLEHQILGLRAMGYNDIEIAGKLGYSKQRIGQIRSLLYERFLSQWTTIRKRRPSTRNI